jgi:pectate lyase C
MGSGGSSAGMSGGGGTMGGRSGAGGMASAGSGNAPAIGPRPCGCETPAGEFGTVNSTIVVDSGEVYDGACKIFRANPETLGAGDQGEGQLPIFRVEDGGTLKNVVIGASGADGIHLYGDVTLENIHWLDIGEDAMTVKESGTVYLDCGSSAHGEDKTFQVNAASDIFISNFTATDAGKFMRQNGDTTFEVNVTIDHSDISFMDEVIFRTDSSSSHVTFTNSRYSNLGDGLFIFGDAVVNGNSAQSTVSNLVEY